MKVRERRSIILLVGILASPICLPAAEELSAQIRLLNNSVTTASGDSELRQFLTQRQKLIAQIIKEDAPSVRAAALDQAVIDRLRIQSPALLDLVEESGDWTGSLEVLAEMDFQNHKAWTHRYLRLSGERIELFGGPKTFHTFDSLGGKQIRVRGIRSEKLVAVDSLAVAAATPIACTTTGAQNIAVLLATSPSNPALPKAWTTGAITNMFFGSSGSTLNTYWRETSYGKTSAQGTVFGPFALASDYSCNNSDALRQAVIAAAQGTVDFTQFNRAAVVFPAKSCSFGGLASIGCNFTDLPQTYSFSWFPVESFEDPGSYVGILAHEAGHNLGLNHANSDDFGAIPLAAPGNDGVNTEYGDPFSVMGVGEQGGSGQYNFGQYSAQHKAQILGWLDSGSYLQVNSAGTYSVAPLEETSGVRGLHILRDANTRTWLWLESRQPIGQADTALGAVHSNLFAGAMIHYENPDLDPLHTYLLDFQPASTPNNFDTSAMLPGQTWTDPYSLLRLTVNSAASNGVSVNVGYDMPCASMTLSGALIPLTGGSGAVQVTAPAGCSWTASTSNAWLQLGGTTSGNGNGTVNFSAGANSGAAQRNGFIGVQRQNFPVVQEGPGLNGISASPLMGSGASGTLTLQFADTNGYADMDQVNGVIGGSPYGSAICYFTVNPAGYMFLLNDAGTDFLATPVFLDQPGTSISNSTCTIFASGSSVGGSGDVLTANVHFQAAASVTGSYDVFGWAHNSVGFGGPYTLGQWSFPSTSTTTGSVISGLSPNSVNAGGPAFTLTVNGTGFVTGSIVEWNGSAVATSYGGPNQLSASIPASLIASPGNVNVTVQNLGTNISNIEIFSIIAASGSNLLVISHIADGDGWRSSIVLVNTDTVPALYTVSFRNDAGASYVPTLALGAASGSIPAGGSTIIETADTASTLTSGWAQVTSSQAVGGTAIFRYDPWSQEAAVPLLTNGGVKLEIPYQAGSGLALGIALANPSATQTANITEVIRDQSGNQLSSRNFTLAALNHTSFIPTFPSNIAGGGVVEYDANVNVFGLGIRSTGQAFTSLDAVLPLTTSARTISHIADGGGWRSSIVLVNTDTVPALYTVSFRNDAGASYVPTLALGAASGSIPVGGSTIIETADTASTLTSGWAQVTSSQAVGGTAIFRYDPWSQEAAVPLLTSGSVKLEIPYQAGSGLALGIALANPSATQTANITEVIRDQSGNQLSSRNFTLAALNHTSFIPTFPSNIAGGGVVEYDANVNVFGLGIRSAGQAFTSVRAAYK